MNHIFARQKISLALNSHSDLDNLDITVQQLKMLCAKYQPALYPQLVEKLKCHEILIEFTDDLKTFDRFKTNAILALEFYPPQARKIILLNIAVLIGDNNPEHVTPQHIYQQGQLLGFSLPKHIVR